ncbi:MAG: hypothetical protein DCC58_08035 [Chloroflexi bacterium]|nr:MAG: hypothetical protein DCC58_08035 [Chloroflexota bacterium]
MVHVLSIVEIEDVAKLVSVFSTRGAKLRASHGSHGAQLFVTDGDPKKMVAIFEWDSREAFEAFLSDPNTAPTMASGGVKGRPDFTVLEKVGEFPA